MWLAEPAPPAPAADPVEHYSGWIAEFSGVIDALQGDRDVAQRTGMPAALSCCASMAPGLPERQALIEIFSPTAPWCSRRR